MLRPLARPDKPTDKQQDKPQGGQKGNKKGSRKGTASHGKDRWAGGKEVALVLRLPKPVRKRLRAKAADLGMTAEEAAAQVVRMWVEG
jgi:hypothetical protein